MVDGFNIQNRTTKPLAIALRGSERGLRGRDGGVIYPIYSISLFGIVTMNIHCTTNIS
jgi:hypothetical protein